MKKTKKGFTLVELLVVIAILAILATVTIVGYTVFVNKANQSKAESELRQIVTYVNAEFADDGKWDNLEKATMTTAQLETKINNCQELNGFSDVTVKKENNVFTITYTVAGVTVSRNLD